MQTTSRNLVEALLGVLAVWMAVRNIPSYITSMVIAPVTGTEELQPENVRLLVGMHLAVSIGGGFALLILRRRIALWLVHDSNPVDAGESSLLAVGTAVMAIYFLGAGMTAVVGQVIAGLEYGHLDPSFTWSGINSIIVGVLLFVAARWIPKLWAKTRRDKSETA